MSDTDTKHVDDVLELAALMRPAWPTISAGIRASGVPVCEGDGGEGGGEGGSGEGGAGGEGGQGAAGTQEPDHKAEAEKWKALARKHEQQAKQNSTAAQRLQQIEDEKKTAEQKAADKAAEAEKRAATAELTTLRYDVALDKAPDGMSIAQVRKLAKRLAGTTREELEADVAELFEEFTPADDKPDDTSRRRPKERLRPGAVSSSEPEEMDPQKLAAQVPRQY